MPLHAAVDRLEPRCDLSGLWRFELLSEFKKFAMRGNVVDMAVGIIIGAAFGKIVSSFVADIIMPPIGMAMGNVDFSNLFVNLGDGTFATPRGRSGSGRAHHQLRRLSQHGL